MSHSVIRVKTLKRILKSSRSVEIYCYVNIHDDEGAYIKLNKKQALNAIPEWAREVNGSLSKEISKPYLIHLG